MQQGFIAPFIVAGVALLSATAANAQPAPEEQPPAGEPRPAPPAGTNAAPALAPEEQPDAGNEEAPSTAPDATSPEGEPAGEAPVGAEAPVESQVPSDGTRSAPPDPTRFGDSFGTSAAPPRGLGSGAPATASDAAPWSARTTDATTLGSRDAQRPATSEEETGIYAEDWWSHTRPILELHGYFRARAELFHNFSLGRLDSQGRGLWLKPLDNPYTPGGEDTAVGLQEDLCTADEAGTGSNDNPGELVRCRNKTQAGANIRFRINPELHISDNVRVLSQIDLLDNLILGSTPTTSVNQPSGSGGYEVSGRTGYTPFGYYNDTQTPPRSGVNSFQDSIMVKRAWGEYETPVGMLSFGRMPDHWGLGMLHNAGDGYDDDYQSTVDRIEFTSGIESLGVYVTAAWDFVNEGPTSAHLALPQGQPYDLAQLDDVDQYALIVQRKLDPRLTELKLANGDLVINGGVYLTYRKQLLANDDVGACGEGAALGCSREGLASGYVRRDAEAWIPDVWLQLLYKKFRFELEAVMVRGSIQNTEIDRGAFNYTTAPGSEGWKIREWGVASQLEQRLVEDRLRLGFGFGWASGDPDAAQDGAAMGLSPGLDGLQNQVGDDTFSTFRFHPNYRVDLILHRNLLTRVQGTYYFRPSVEYDLIRSEAGQRLGGGFAAIWSRASEYVQAPGHARDLGVELNGSLYFQAKDGALNDNPDTMGGFYTMLQYGILFPLDGLGYQELEAETVSMQGERNIDIEPAQILRWYLGVMF